MDRNPADAQNTLRQVDALAQKDGGVARGPVRSASGVELEDDGDRVTPGDEPVKHKLQAALEEGRTADAVVTPASLRQAVEELLQDQPVFADLVPDDDERRQLLHLFATLPLAPALAVELTSARDERPEVLQHSLKVAYCAAALAHRCGLPHHEVENAVAAGLFHDLGLLHVDPELLRGRRPLLEHERNYLYAHPLTSYLILEHNPIWHPVVSTAVLEHHERIDGSGYPKGLAGSRLGHLGQLLAVAELGATLLSYVGGPAMRSRLGVVLSMNDGKLNREYANRLLEMFPPAATSGMPPPPLGRTLEVLVDLSVCFMRWQAVAKQTPVLPLAAFIDKRMLYLSHSIADIGIDLEYWSTFNTDTDFDEKSLTEMEAAAHESIWQVHAIADEARRHWEHLIGDSKANIVAVEGWLTSVDAMRRD